MLHKLSCRRSLFFLFFADEICQAVGLLLDFPFYTFLSFFNLHFVYTRADKGGQRENVHLLLCGATSAHQERQTENPLAWCNWLKEINTLANSYPAEQAKEQVWTYLWINLKLEQIFGGILIKGLYILIQEKTKPIKITCCSVNKTKEYLDASTQSEFGSCFSQPRCLLTDNIITGQCKQNKSVPKSFKVRALATKAVLESI